MLATNNTKITFIGLMIVCITVLHYVALAEMQYEHAFLRLLYYVPLIFAGLWYGLKGSLVVCVTVIVLFTPHVFIQWHGFSAEDFDLLMEGVLFVGIAILLGILMDREKRHMKALMESRNLAAVGRAVNEIAHDMKSPLMAIGGFVNQVARKMPPEDPRRKKLDIVIKETSRLEEMVNEMLEFSRSVQLNKSPVDINELVMDMAKLLSHSGSQSNVQLVTEISPDLPTIMGDRDKIQRILTNIITNAIQASPEGQKVRIITESRADGIAIKVVDYGAGIKADQQESVFYPFFTTKKGGTGLGLGVAKKITEAHGGKIYFYPNQGHPGVTFVVELPVDFPPDQKGAAHGRT